MAARAAGRDLAALCLDLQVDLLAEHGDVPWGRDAQANLLAHDREHRHLDVVADHDALVGLACQNQHPFGTSLPLLRGTGVLLPAADEHQTSAVKAMRRLGRDLAAGALGCGAAWHVAHCAPISTRSAAGS